MILYVAVVLAGLALLLWSADRFVEGASAAAGHAGLSPLLIGMVVVGFGTSAPEMLVSAISAYEGNAGLALGNAYGSNITNIGLILGLTALMSPIAVSSRVLRRELPILSAITLLAVLLLWNGELTRTDASVLLVVFLALMGWTIFEGIREREDSFNAEMAVELKAHAMPLGSALLNLAIGLVLLVVSSRMLVWGAVGLARTIGVDDMIIGLTIVAAGTSLPELASSIIAARKGEHDIALGNILGSNLFNTLAVVGIAGLIHPMPVAREVLYRDCLVMGALTLSLFVVGYGFRREGRINRYEGAGLLAVYIGYTGLLVLTAIGARP